MSAPAVAVQSAPASEGLPALLNHAQVARLLGLHRCTLHRWRHQELVPRPLHIGTAQRWRRDEVLAWIAAGSPPASRWTWPPPPERRPVVRAPRAPREMGGAV